MNARGLAAIAALSLPLALSSGLAQRAWAHGSMASPPSRDFFCRFLDKGGVESPQSAGCKAAKARSGTEPVYNFEEPIISNAARRGLVAAPEGQICNAGRPFRSGFNLPPKVANYTAAPVSAGVMTFEYQASTPHPTDSFEVFISKPEYDGSTVLQKADLIQLTKKQGRDFTLAGDTFRFDVEMPQRTAGERAVVLVVWSVKPLESNEGYYTCSDVIYR